MYLYEFYNFDYDDTVHFILAHDNKLTKEEYENIVLECIKKVYAKIERNQKILESDEELSPEEIERLEIFECSLEYDVIRNVRKLLTKEYGFKELKAEHTFTFDDGNFVSGNIKKNSVL